MSWLSRRTTNKGSKRGILLLLSLVGALAQSRADQGWEGHILQLTWENDATAQSDKHYTQGARIRYLSSDAAVPQWLHRFSDHLPALGLKVEGLKFGFEVGQEMYTPEDLDATDVVKEDRPYAGWLYASALFQRRGIGPKDIPLMEQLRLDLGVVGPEAQGEETQKDWHGKDPRGWKHQLDTELGMNLRYERWYLLRFKSHNKWGIDFLPGFNTSIGNIDTHLGLGSLVRLGYNIPNEFEVPGKKTSKNFGAYLFAGLDGRLVIRNIFLDGNTWHSSHSVDKEPFVADMKAGVTMVLKFLELTVSQDFRTQEFTGQKHADSFGSLTLSFKF